MSQVESHAAAAAPPKNVNRNALLSGLINHVNDVAAAIKLRHRHPDMDSLQAIVTREINALQQAARDAFAALAAAREWEVHAAERAVAGAFVARAKRINRGKRIAAVKFRAFGQYHAGSIDALKQAQAAQRSPMFGLTRASVRRRDGTGLRHRGWVKKINGRTKWICSTTDAPTGHDADRVFASKFPEHASPPSAELDPTQWLSASEAARRIGDGVTAACFAKRNTAIRDNDKTGRDRLVYWPDCVAWNANRRKTKAHRELLDGLRDEEI